MFALKNKTKQQQHRLGRLGTALFMRCGLLSLALQMESEEKDATAAAASAAASRTSLEKILQELNVSSDRMSQLACKHHCWVLSSPATVVPADANYVGGIAPPTPLTPLPPLIYLQICKARDKTVAPDVRSDNPSELLYTNCS